MLFFMSVIIKFLLEVIMYGYKYVGHTTTLTSQVGVLPSGEGMLPSSGIPLTLGKCHFTLICTCCFMNFIVHNYLIVTFIASETFMK